MSSKCIRENIGLIVSGGVITHRRKISARGVAEAEA